MIEEIVTFKNPKGLKIAGKVYAPDKAGKYPVVIFSHGFNCSYRGLEHHGNGFADAGIVCVFFDFCGGAVDNLSEGKMTDMTVLTEAEDLKCVIEAVSKLDYVDENRLFLQGESMGGFVSAYVAAQIPEKVKALVLWYPAFVIPDDSKKRFEAGDNTCFGNPISPDFNKDSMNIDIISFAAGYTGPVKIIHGDKDGIAPIDYSYRAVEKYNNASLLVIENSDHGFMGADSDRAREASVSFIKEYI